MPQSASIQYSPAMYFTQNVWTGYVLDDWKVSANLTLNLGLRYEFFPPLQEKYNEMANLDIAPGFANVAVVAPSVPGPYSGSFPAGLINPDYRNFSPRLGLAYKVPFIKRSTIIRAGYGIYYNGQSYIPFGLKLAQQPQPPGLPPFAVSKSVNTSPETPLTLATVWCRTISMGDHEHLRRGPLLSHTLRANLESHHPARPRKRILHGSGVSGHQGNRPGCSDTAQRRASRNHVQFRDPAWKCHGIHLRRSHWRLHFNALQTHLMRRFRGGISMNARYTFSKSIDDASSFGGVGSTVAQNWLDLAAERGLSSFNRTSVFTMSWVYTSPFGNPNSRYASSGWAGRLLRNWSLSGGVTAESGTPLTARVLGNEVQLAQTNGVGSERADATGLPVESGSGFFNLAAFTVPPAGQFGNAGRNTIPGPGLVSVNVAFGRSFQFGDTRRRLEFRAEANNVLNQVNFRMSPRW